MLRTLVALQSTVSSIARLLEFGSPLSITTSGFWEMRAWPDRKLGK